MWSALSPERPAALARCQFADFRAVVDVPVTRLRRRSVLVLAGDGRGSDRGARALANALGEIGVEVVYLGREVDARRIAQHAADERADAVEVCLSGVGGVSLLRGLIRELRLLDRAEVGIVVHKVW